MYAATLQEEWSKLAETKKTAWPIRSGKSLGQRLDQLAEYVAALPGDDAHLACLADLMDERYISTEDDDSYRVPYLSFDEQAERYIGRIGFNEGAQRHRPPDDR